MTVRVGLDIDGVISACPALFSFLSKAIQAAGGEVFVVTGCHTQPTEMLTETRKAQLAGWNIAYDVLYLAPRPIAANKAKYAKQVCLDFFIDNRGLNIMEVGAVCPVALFMSESEDDLIEPTPL
jgi:hypothetical protein